MNDLRYAVRTLWHARGFTLAVTATLAIGIAGATLMFALVNGILLEPLPVRDPDRLVVAWKRTATGTFSHYPFGGDAVREVREQARSFASVGAFSYNGAMQLPVIERDAAAYIQAGVVDGEFFRTLDVVPILGRTLAAADDATGAERTLVIDERLWQQRYGRAADIVGRQLRLLGEIFTIVGVVPAVDLPRGAHAWITLAGFVSREMDPEARNVMRRDQDFVGRLRDGVTVAQADDEIRTLTDIYEKRAGGRVVSSLKPYTEEVVGDARRPVTMLFGATLLVLMIACANVANLVLMRGESRRAQFAVCAALGASRTRLVRQVGMEALVLCGLGGIAGVLLAVAGLGAVMAFAPPELPRVESVRIALPVMLFAVASTIVAGAAATAVGAMMSTNLSSAVVNSASTRLTPAAFRRSRRGFVVTQVALSLTILAGAGVLSRTLMKLQSAEMGFSAERMAFVELLLPPDRYRDAKVRRPFLEELSRRVRAIPGVAAVTPIAVRPYAGLSGWDMPQWVAEGQGPVEAARNPGLDLQSVYPGHFETMEIPILEGRAINDFDREGRLAVAVISEHAARQVWAGQSALGRRLKWGGVDSNGPWFTIVGVAATTRYRELADPREAVYLPAAQFVDGADSLALRVSVPLSSIAPALRDRVRDLDRGVFVLRAQPFDDYVARPLARPRGVALLGNAFGAIALALAAVGFYGVLAAFVRQSTREIGVRVALGATAGDVRALVLGEAARLAILGIALGLAGAFAAGRFLQGMLFGIQPADPFTLAAAVAVLLLTALAACWFPIRHATRIDAVRLLRDN